MATSLSPEEMRALVVRHAERESLHDWEGAFATMVSDGPFYELFPYRLRVSGPDAILAMWLRLMGDGDAPGCFADATVAPETYHLTEYVNEDSIVHSTKWEFVTDAGERQPVDHVVIFRFEGDRMLSETVFCDTSVMRYMDRLALDAGFRSHPGVEQI